uniref:Roadblock/LAMTOR2 domain-containing protein n=1 Tax=candidate division WOR-3 bacterium TaxID=2052148 RepID=A0A7V3ZWR4_UNCW3
MAKIDDVMQEFLSNVDEVLMSMIVNLDDAIPITGHTTDESIDVTVPLAYLTEVARKAMTATESAGLGTCEDVLLTTSEYFIIIRIIPDSNYVHIVVLTRKGNWGVTKILMGKFAPKFKEALP